MSNCFHFDPNPRCPQVSNCGAYGAGSDSDICGCGEGRVGYGAMTPFQTRALPNCSNSTPSSVGCGSRSNSARFNRTRFAGVSKSETRPRMCVPNKGPLSEYQEKYRKWSRYAMKRAQHPPIPITDRPPWNHSIFVPTKPYVESLDAAEAKLRALDNSEEPPGETLLIARQKIYDKYRISRQFGRRDIPRRTCSNLELYEEDSAVSDC